MSIVIDKMDIVLLLLQHPRHHPTRITGECLQYIRMFDNVWFLLYHIDNSSLQETTFLYTSNLRYTILQYTRYIPMLSLISACPTSRTTQPISLRLTSEMINKLTPKQPSNPYRLVLFCTMTDRIHFNNCVVEFPTHAEIRCNGSIVTANLRGIKNKPGTINPPDLTQHAILMAGVTNKIDVTFAESKVAYSVLIYLVEKHTVAELVDKIKKKGFIAKDLTLNRSSSFLMELMVVRAAAQDADIVAGPETLSLKDPISMTRIELPAKSRYCGHTACFDAAIFLTLNEQTPTWSCPICARAITTEEDLFLDG
jgi:E3 SUMO-protein ligase PIAS1